MSGSLPHIHGPSVMIQLEDIAHVAYYAEDLATMSAFLTDFGLAPVSQTGDAMYMKGRGAQPYAHVTLPAGDCRSGMAYVAFEVVSVDELHRAAAIPGASAVEEVAGPCAGLRVRLRDPDGFAIHLVHWKRDAATTTDNAQPPACAAKTNTPAEKSRLGATLRPPCGPAPIFRLGHVLLHVRDIAATDAWYTRHLGLRLSDGLTEPGGDRMVAGFYRLSKADQYVDHHAIGFVEAPASLAGTAHHASFEVDSFDAISAGHYWLGSRGWKPRWGVGRHVLGSQVFDYWHDPAGNVVEHYADGDVFNESTPAAFYPNSIDMLACWAPPYPGATGTTDAQGNAD